MTKKRALLLGGTGAIGIYVIPELINKGYIVDVTSRSEQTSKDLLVNYIKGDAQDIEFLKGVIRDTQYDVVIDFMLYETKQFKERINMLLKACRQYIFLSSYRVFAKDSIITERSPRLLDIIKDEEYLATDEYALAKARQEDILTQEKQKNWTIVRPSITYSRNRFQFGTVEADVTVWRALRGLPVTIPEEIYDKKTTMTWAGDTARLIVKLVGNDSAFGQDYNIATDESRSWREIASIYSKAIGLKVKTVSTKDHVSAAGYPEVGYLIKYNRMYDRVIDNSKILEATGEVAGNLLTPEEGLKRELRAFKNDPQYVQIDYAKQARIDRLTNTILSLKSIPRNNIAEYIKFRFPKTFVVGKKIKGARDKIRKSSTLFINKLRALKRKARVRTRVNMYYRHISYLFRYAGYKNPDGLVITLDDYSNYGNIIQRFALQEFLRKNKKKFVSFDHNIPIENDLSSERLAAMAEFSKMYIPKVAYDLHRGYPVYIVGSDQIWRNWHYSNPQRDLGFFFLNFLKNNNIKRIAYAASFGQDTAVEAGLDKKLIKYLKPLLEKFDHIAIREKSGIELLRKEWGLDATQVLDPTLLLTTKDYNKLISHSPARLRDIDDVFIYIIAETPEISQVIDTTSKFMQYSVSGIHLSQMAILPPIEYWFKGFRDAKLVITDSFHGTVFAILNNTPFVAVENSVSGAARIRNLLEYLEIPSGRLIHKKDVHSYNPNNLSVIDWQRVNDNLTHLRDYSSNWLLEALKK